MSLYRHPVGEKLYVWTMNSADGPSKKSALISAHGMYSCMNGMETAPLNLQLHYYSPHGYVLNDPGLDAVLTGSVAIKESVAARKSRDYVLGKYQNSATNRHNTMGEDYEIILNTPERFERIAGAANVRIALPPRGTTRSMGIRDRKQLERFENGDVKMDVITVRNRRFMAMPRFSWVIMELIRHGYRYEAIHCSFCRSFLSDGILSAIPGFETAFGARPNFTPVEQ